jgi:hypothetical protein
MTMFDVTAVVAAAVLCLMLISGSLGVFVGGVAGLLMGLIYRRRLGRGSHGDDYLDDPSTPEPEPDNDPGDDTGEIPLQEADFALLSGYDGDGPGLYGGGRHRLRESDEPEWPTAAAG